jgi:hypothetical protein
VISSSAESRCALLRSIATPTAIRGAVAGLTCADQAVELSPSIVRLGSPNQLAG